MKRFIVTLCVVTLIHISGYAQNTDEIKTIHQAAALGNARSILAFLQEGVSVNEKDAKGRTPLMAASESGMSRIIPLLLERGADIDAVDNEGNTAMHIGVSKGQVRVITALLAEGANTTIKNSKGFTARELASQSGNARAISAFPDEMSVYPRQTEGDYTATQAPEGAAKLKQILEDPNEVRARLSADPKLVSEMDVLFKALEAEETKWTSRKQRIKNTFFNAVRKEIDSEILFIQDVAKQEDANDIVHDLDVLQSTWKSIFAKSSRKMREASRGMTAYGMREPARPTRTRGRRVMVEDAMNTRRGIRGRESEVVEPADPHENYIDSWGTIDDTNLDTIYESTQEEVFKGMAAIRSSAEKTNKTRILTAIDGVMLERTLRSERSLAVYNLNKQEMSEAANPTNMNGAPNGTRRGRRGTTQTEQNGRRRRR